MSRALFVTATGTDAGKTYVAALIVKRLREAGINAGYYKAALSGAEERGGRLIPGDADFVARASGMTEPPESLVSYVYKNPLSPHLAAQIEGNPPELDAIKRDFARALKKYDYLCVEGCGGIVCPIRWDERKIMLEDIIKACGLSIIIVSPSGLGSINSAVLTVEHARAAGIEVRGIIMNGYDETQLMHRDNKYMIEQLTGVRVAACVKRGDTEMDIPVEQLCGLFKEAGKIDA